MQTTTKVKIGIGTVLVIIIALFFHYTLPRTAVVQISGTDIKRMDKAAKASKSQGEAATKVKSEQQTSDVRFINSISRDNKTMVFKNHDTGWGWPPYLKFNSADITAQAQAFAADPNKPWVLVKYYGWRSTVFTMFPNVLALKVVDRDYSHIPLFNIVFFTLLIIFGFFVRRQLKKLASWVSDRKNTKNDEKKT